MNVTKINENEQWMLLVFLLDEIRKQKGMTNLKIAELSGIAPTHTSRFFSCKFPPTLPTFLKIAKAIGVNFFFENTESKVDFNVAFEKAMEQIGRKPKKLSQN